MRWFLVFALFVGLAGCGESSPVAAAQENEKVLAYQIDPADGEIFIVSVDLGTGAMRDVMVLGDELRDQIQQGNTEPWIDFEARKIFWCYSHAVYWRTIDTGFTLQVETSPERRLLRIIGRD